MVDKLKNKKHIDFPAFDKEDGRGNKALREPVPDFKARTGDYYITAEGPSKNPGVNNNAIIVFGRDRAAYVPSRSGAEEMAAQDPSNELQVSGFSDHMGAGAIDIIVGRGAPYAMPIFSSKESALPPAYCWQQSSKIKKGDIDLLGDPPQHPGWVTDAARIYITQMADIDRYFKIKGEEKTEESSQPLRSKTDVNPSSAIVLKADKIRLHSRRDIKIIAGGDEGTKMDSNWYQIKEPGRIHLMSGNGSLDPQQPMVLGDNLRNCLRAIVDVMQDITEVIHTCLSSQMKLNIKNGLHLHAGGTGATTGPDPISSFESALKTLSDASSIINVYSTKTHNIKSIADTYLKLGSKDHSGRTSILSAHHTVN